MSHIKAHRIDAGACGRVGSGRLLETYGYEGLSLNPGLTDVDFDPGNPAYNF